jgi:putative phosphoribosyl transferase
MLFNNRRHAGRLLLKRLRSYRKFSDAVVLAIPRGGVVLGYELAKALDLPLDIVVTKKIGAPFQGELAIGAAGPGEVVVLDDQLIQQLGVGDDYIEKQKKRVFGEIERRIKTYRGNREVVDVSGKTAILVDDGIATGATVESAIIYLRKKGAKKIVLAVPVAPEEVKDKFQKLVDELVILQTPPGFQAVGQFYDDFPQVTDKEVIQLLRSV